MHKIQDAICIAGWPCWRNNVGFDKSTKVRYGLGLGSADLISCVAGHFVAIEVKSARGRVSPAQEMWKKTVTRSGGLWFLVRDESCIQYLIEELRQL